MPPFSRSRPAAVAYAATPVWLVLVLLSATLSLTASPSRKATAIFTAQSPRDTLFVLPVSWLVLDSVTIFRNGQTLSELVDWRIVDPGNRLWLFRPLGASDTLRVEYLYEPYPVFRLHSRHSLRALKRAVSGQESPDTSRIAELNESAAAAPEQWSRLQKSGSLIRSVQVGTNQDLALESALNLQIEGRVGRNVDVVAALTDQSTPIQPEGTTETLNELQKVFVSVRSPRLAATLGDFTLDLPGGLYDSYTRKLSGVMAQANISTATASASGAVSRGEFQTNNFNGREADQGPYPLSGGNGQIGILVRAGTERVWLDGEVMRRGEGNDYVIDYASGEITFTSRRIITSDSRIVVDFEYASDNFERFYGSARSEVTVVPNRLSATATWITESDDRNRPLGLSLTDSDRAALRLAGDNRLLAVSFSADSVGIGKGDYVRRDTLFFDTTYTIFVYSPRDSTHSTGQWQVTFDDFGVGSGEYEPDADSVGIIFFHWVGPRRGRYRPYRRLPMPEQHSIGDVRVNATPWTGLNVSGELAASNHDLNTFSGYDDQKNSGFAGTAQANFARDHLDLMGWDANHFDANLRFRRRDQRFSEINRASEIEFSRDWDVGTNAGTEETIREGSARLSPWQFLSLSGGYGDLTRPDQSSSRKDAGASLSIGKLFRISGTHLDLESNDRAVNRKGNWIRQHLQATGNLAIFAPRAGIDRERRRNRFTTGFDGYRFFEYYTGLGTRLPLNLATDSEYRRRLADVLDSTDAFHPNSHAYTASSEIQWRPPEGGSALLRYAHRERRYYSLDSSNIRNDVGRLEALLSPRSRLVEANVVYEVARTQTQNQILVAIEVPDGTGSYRREGDHYVPDDQGNYILVPRNTGEFSPATELKVNTLFWLRPDEMSSQSVAPWLRALSTQTEIQLEEQTRYPLSARLAFLDQSLFRGDSTLSGTLSLLQDLHIYRLSQKLAVRLRYRNTASLQNQYLNGGQERTLHEGGVRVRARYFSYLRGETEATLSRERLRYVSGSFSNRDIDRFEITQDNTLSLNRSWDAGMALSGSEVNDQLTQTHVSLRELRPHATLNRFAKGRLDGEATWIHASSNKSQVPFELGQGANRGDNFRWSLRGTYQFGQNFSGSVSYTGRVDAGEKAVHTGRLEVRATL